MLVRAAHALSWSPVGVRSGWAWGAPCAVAPCGVSRDDDARVYTRSTFSITKMGDSATTSRGVEERNVMRCSRYTPQSVRLRLRARAAAGARRAHIRRDRFGPV